MLACMTLRGGSGTASVASKGVDFDSCGGAAGDGAAGDALSGAAKGAVYVLL